MRLIPAILVAFASLVYSATAPLTIFKPVRQRLEDGPAVPPSFTFVSGQFIFLSFQVAGYKVADEQKIHLSYKVDALDPKGVRLVEPFAGTVDTTLADEDKNWKPKVRHQILIPPLAPSGTYKISIQVTDDLNKGASVSQDIPFEVRGRDVPPSDTPVVRNFQFYRGEDEREPLKVAAYKPGDTLWARFDIVGYKFGPGNSYRRGLRHFCPGAERQSPFHPGQGRRRKELFVLSQSLRARLHEPEPAGHHSPRRVHDRC